MPEFPAKDEVLHQAALFLNEGRYAEAMPLYKGMADSGDVQSQFLLGWMYRDGWGVTADVQQATIWFRRAADGGSPDGAFELAKLFEGQREYDKAFEQYERAAATSYGPALYRLGRMYEFGKGVVKSIDKALFYYESAAAQGHVFGIKNLALLLMQGRRGMLARCRGLLLFVKCMYLALSLGWKDHHSVRLRD